jgi:imidazole glycerol-phosphate synthase subunit HisF
MLRTRVIPCLLLKGRGFYKTTRFKKPVYLGDPINILKIFNDKEVDEIVVLDITATIENKRPSFDLLREMASECFMPLAYGGGITSLQDMKTLYELGFEKICLNTAACRNPDLVGEAAEAFGSQSVVISLDVRKKLFGGYEVVTQSGGEKTGKDPVSMAREMESRGAGELIVNSIDRDGTMQGYELGLIRQVAEAVNIPIVACGGAGSVSDLAQAAGDGGASAVAAGSMFVFQGPHRAVLINVPSRDELEAALP